MMLSLLMAACSDNDNKLSGTLSPISISTSKIALTNDNEMTGNAEVVFPENWTIIEKPDWCNIIATMNDIGTPHLKVDLKFTPTSNTDTDRTGTIKIQCGGITKTIEISQEKTLTGGTADQSATEAAKSIAVGWNLGNSLECTSVADDGTVSADETSWGNPKTTQEMIDGVKAAGFEAVRIPCAWSGYMIGDSIDEAWLKRVREVVNYCLRDELYAIINIHWDGGWLEENPTTEVQEAVNAKQKLLWTQIANYFKDYGSKLLFAGVNEVHMKDYKDPQNENYEVQRSYLKTFVEAVRATGGNNTTRNLIVQTFNTNCAQGVEDLAPHISEIEQTGHLLAEVHFYDPFEFALDEDETNKYWGKPYEQYGISDWGQEDWVDQTFASIKTAFVDKGYPVILGEYSPMIHSLTDETMMASRKYYLKYVTAAAKKNGLVPFYWDNGSAKEKGSGIFNRSDNMKVVDTTGLEGIMEGAKTAYPY